MAKRKGAVALFEVIHKDKRFAKPSTSALTTPAWWYKGKTQAQPAPTASSKYGPGEAKLLEQNERDSWPAIPGATAGETGGVGPMDAAPRPHIHERNPGAVTWTSGTIIGATAVVVIALGMILTRHPRQATASDGPQPDVLNVTPGDNATGVAPPVVRVGSEDDGAQPAQAPPARQKLLYYCLIQWYPDQKTAQAASDLLAQYGVTTTVEENLRIPEVPRDGFGVVGLDGFTRTRSSKCQTYLTRVKAISTKFAPKPTSFRAFRPIMIQWMRGTNAPVSPSSPPGDSAPPAPLGSADPGLPTL